MDSFTNTMLTSIVNNENTDEVADIYKQLSKSGDEPSKEQVKWFFANKGKLVNTKKNGKGHTGIVYKLNKSSCGLYPGGRYPIYIKILTTISRFSNAMGKIYEFDTEQLTLIDDNQVQSHLINKNTVKDWDTFNKLCHDMCGSVISFKSKKYTHKLIGLDHIDFNFILDYMKE